MKPDLCFIFAFYCFFCDSNHDFEGKLQKKFRLKDFVYDIKKIEDNIYKLLADKVVTYSIINIILTDYRWNITEESKCGLTQSLDRKIHVFKCNFKTFFNGLRGWHLTDQIL